MASNAYDTHVTMERDDGQTFAFDGQPWALAEDGLDGWTTWALEVSTAPNVLDDGSALVSKRQGETARTLSAVCLTEDADEASAERYRALAFFNPEHSFTAHVEHRGVTRWCDGHLAGIECNLQEGRYPAALTFTLLCLDPWMRDEDGNEAPFGDSVPKLGWPFVSHAPGTQMADGARLPHGFNASTLVYDGMNTVYNNGDAPTYYRVVMAAKGYISRPTITKDGRFVRYNGALAAGDVLVIDFESAPPRVTLNGENVIQACSRDSSFTGMVMQVGANRFAVTIDNEENRGLLTTQVLFHKKRNGV